MHQVPFHSLHTEQHAHNDKETSSEEHGCAVCTKLYDNPNIHSISKASNYN